MTKADITTFISKYTEFDNLMTIVFKYIKDSGIIDIINPSCYKPKLESWDISEKFVYFKYYDTDYDIKEESTIQIPVTHIINDTYKEYIDNWFNEKTNEQRKRYEYRCQQYEELNKKFENE